MVASWRALVFVLALASCVVLDVTTTKRCTDPSLTYCGSWSCLDTMNDTSNCGGCGVTCAYGALCTGGVCVCPSGRFHCGATCADLLTDGRNCGTCGVVCPIPGSCVRGRCQCQDGYTVCGTVCVDLRLNVNHCGACGRACRRDEICFGGSCACPTDRVSCGGTCIDLRNDRAHCGACGRACAVGDNCVDGECRCALMCSGVCVRPSADTDRCARCENECPGGAPCIQGECVCRGPAGRVCDGRCIDTGTDPQNCGACGRVCPGATRCSRGSCECEDGLTQCATGVCIDTGTDPQNCGACGRPCMSGRVCRDRQCVCAGEAETMCEGQCVDPRNDLHNCGGCGLACPPGAMCRGGRCSVRPTEPLSGARLGNGALTFRWDSRGAEVQVCADRECARVLHTLTSSSLEARVPTPLAPGVYFWRLRATGGASVQPVTWSFRVDARRTSRPGVLPPDLDVDGDGLADVVALTGHGTSIAVFLGSRSERYGALAPIAVPASASDERGRVTLEHGGDELGAGAQNVRVLRILSSETLSRTGERIAAASSQTHAVFDLDLNGFGDHVGLGPPDGLRLWLRTAHNRTREVELWRDRTMTRVSVAGIGDANGDGFSDVVVASPTDVPPRAWVYFGSSLGLDRAQLLPLAPRSAGFGDTVSAAGDVNGDGYADLLVRVGRTGAAVYLGGSQVTLHRWLVQPGGAELTVSRAGDVNGDGYGDLLGVPSGRDEGWLYLGGAAGLDETPVILRGSAWLDCVAPTGAPGDVNGDGFDDVVVGAPSSSEVRVLHGAWMAPLTRVTALRGAEGEELGGGVL